MIEFTAELLATTLCNFATSVEQIFRQYLMPTCLAFLCLNCILVCLFLLKSLFFKPKFVENRHQTISIDKGLNANELDFSQIETCVDGNVCARNADGGGGAGAGAGSPGGAGGGNIAIQSDQNMQALITNRIQQLYNSESLDSIEYVSSNSDLIKLKEKIGSGFIGVLYRVQVVDQTALEQQTQQGPSSTNEHAATAKEPPKCAKLVDFQSLRQIIANVNGIPYEGGGFHGANLLSLFRTNTQQSLLTERYLRYYQQFLDAARKLELSNCTRSLPRHPNIVFYEHVLVYDGKERASQRDRQRKIFRGLLQVNKRQLPTLILLMMPQARMNLRSALLCEWAHFSLATATEWSRQIGQGLAYLHLHLGVAHLNLKPENILLFEAEYVEKDGGSGSDADKRPLPAAAAAARPLHSRYVAKLSDCACGLLLPTNTGKVLTASHETSIFTMSPLFRSRFGDQTLADQIAYDVHCYAMTLLLMLVGYESFGKSFMLPQFPTALQSVPRHRLLEIIEGYDRARIPEVWVDLFRQMFTVHSNVLQQQPQTAGMDSKQMSQLLKHPAFELPK